MDVPFGGPHTSPRRPCGGTGRCQAASGVGRAHGDGVFADVDRAGDDEVDDGGTRWGWRRSVRRARTARCPPHIAAILRADCEHATSFGRAGTPTRRRCEPSTGPTIPLYPVLPCASLPLQSCGDVLMSMRSEPALVDGVRCCWRPPCPRPCFPPRCAFASRCWALRRLQLAATPPTIPAARDKWKTPAPA